MDLQWTKGYTHCVLQQNQSLWNVLLPWFVQLPCAIKSHTCWIKKTDTISTIFYFWTNNIKTLDHHSPPRLHSHYKTVSNFDFLLNSFFLLLFLGCLQDLINVAHITGLATHMHITPYSGMFIRYSYIVHYYMKLEYLIVLFKCIRIMPVVTCSLK